MSIKFSEETSLLTLQQDDTSVVISLFGATVLSYQTKENSHLFLSGLAVRDHSKAIRGGIPLVFPQFGAGLKPSSSVLPSHGFARIKMWSLSAMEAEHDGGPRVALELLPDQQTRRDWPFDFRLLYRVWLEKKGRAVPALHTTLHVYNTGDEPFDFQALQHTYLSVPSIHHVQVRGLQGLQYVDKVDQGKLKKFTKDVLKVEGETDCVFVDAPNNIEVICNYGDGGKEGVVSYQVLKQVNKIAATGEASESGSDVVIWNPWILKSKEMKDFEDEEYVQMLCVEPGFVNKVVMLKPGEEWSLKQTLVPTLPLHLQ